MPSMKNFLRFFDSLFVLGFVAQSSAQFIFDTWLDNKVKWNKKEYNPFASRRINKKMNAFSNKNKISWTNRNLFKKMVAYLLFRRKKTMKQISFEYFISEYSI